MATSSESGDGFERTQEGPGVNPRLVLAAVGIAVLVLFVFQNTEEANVEFLFWELELPLAVLLIATIVVTLLVAGMVAWFVARRAKRADKGGMR